MYSSFASESVNMPVPLHNPFSPNEHVLDKKTLEPTYYVDIKSEGLREILRTVLRDVCAVNLNEDKPSV